ncbi:MAG: hypothetical protein GF398_13635 [Chitinivibrionales bacterium]|nr:hypothetical protein [Chitinivibrionales bacterium]
MLAILIYVLTGALALLLGFVFRPRQYPLKTESDLSHSIPGIFHVYYASKFLHPVKHAAKNSGIEEMFRDMDVRFDCSPLTDKETITIKAIGDLMIRKDLVGEGSKHLWDEVGEYAFQGDITIANMEFAINEQWIIDKTIRFSIPLSYALPLLRDGRYGQFDAVSLANNHINDSLKGGIASTLQHLDHLGIKHAGAALTRDDVDSFPIFEAKGAKIALLAYTFGTNGIPLDRGNEHGANVIRFNALRNSDYDPSLIYHHIDLARKRGANYIIAMNHWGIEFEYYPVKRIIDRARDLMEKGIDLIIGHHPHILKPVEKYTAADGRTCLCLYSLGNITSQTLPRAVSNLAAIAGIRLEFGTNASGVRIIRPTGLELMPTYFSYAKRRGRRDNRIFSVTRAQELLSTNTLPDYYTTKDIAGIRKVAGEFQTYFRQRGVIVK